MEAELVTVVTVGYSRRIALSHHIANVQIAMRSFIQHKSYIHNTCTRSMRYSVHTVYYKQTVYSRTELQILSLATKGLQNIASTFKLLSC